MSATEPVADGTKEPTGPGATTHDYGLNNTTQGYGPYSNRHGYGPQTADPVSYQGSPTCVANPGPTGMWAFSITVFLWSFYMVGTRNVSSDMAIVGMGLFVGGLAQFMAGMWEFPRGNVYGSAFFTLYGAFWISYATSLLVLNTNGFNNQFSQESDALGLYLVIWFIISFFFFLGVVRINLAFSFLTFFWALAYLMLAISEWSSGHSQQFRNAGGAFGFVTAVIALYIGLSQLHHSENNLFRMPLGHFGRSPA